MTSLEMDVGLQKQNFEQLEGAARYYEWMLDVMSPYIGHNVLEVGCGQGNIAQYLLDRDGLHRRVHGIDTEESYIRIAKSKIHDADFTAEVGDFRKLNREFDTVLCVNTVEHIADDRDFVRELANRVRPGGTVAILVPAHNFLYSHYDHEVGHYRRYTKRSLRKLLKDADLAVEACFYFNALGAVGWLVNYKWLRRMTPGNGNVKLLELLVPILSIIERIVPIPFGLSVIAVGRKS